MSELRDVMAAYFEPLACVMRLWRHRYRLISVRTRRAMRRGRLQS